MTVTTTRHRKDQSISARIDGTTAEQIDQLAAMQGTSQAEIIRRAVHLLACQCGIRQARSRPGGEHWAVRP